jgi:hypothetical protein
LTATLIVMCGLCVYLPIPAVSGRYTMPAVWGLDLGFAGLLGSLLALPIIVWRRVALAGIVGGLLVVAAANVGRQQKVAARIDLLWQMLECVEREADPAARVAWISSAGLNVEEGIHFRWHLQARGHDRLAVELLDERGQAEERIELAADNQPANFAVTDALQPPPGGPWSLRHEFHAPYWVGRRHFDAYLWSISDGIRDAAAQRP